MVTTAATTARLLAARTTAPAKSALGPPVALVVEEAFLNQSRLLLLQTRCRHGSGLWRLGGMPRLPKLLPRL